MDKGPALAANSRGFRLETAATGKYTGSADIRSALRQGRSQGRLNVATYPAARKVLPLDASRTRVCLVGALLVVCGFSQLAGLAIAIPDKWAAVLGLFTAISCWIAAFALIPFVARRPPARPEINYEREIAERQCAEEALRFSEAETRKLVEADAQE